MNFQLPSQDEITARWKDSDGMPVVSIVCITYNHAQFIHEALSGFLLQDIDEPFEIVITDDASTDGTDDIIRHYEKLYPLILKPLYQKENRFTLGESPSLMHTYPRTKGEFLAFCEGDDYWIAPDKLSLQLKELREEPHVDICFHRCVKRSIENGKIKEEPFRDYGNQRLLFAASEVISRGGGFMPSPTLFFRRSALLRVLAYYEENRVIAAGDYIVQALSSIRGGALYLPVAGSVYRYSSQGSWTSSMAVDGRFAYKWYSKLLFQLRSMKLFCGSGNSTYFAEYSRKVLIGISRKENLTISQKLKLIEQIREEVSLLFFVKFLSSMIAFTFYQELRRLVSSS